MIIGDIMSRYEVLSVTQPESTTLICKTHALPAFFFFLLFPNQCPGNLSVTRPQQTS
jgi:hypothetical protein